MPLLPWRWSVVAIAACAVVAPVLRAGEPPRFESRLDLVQIDVVVVDAQGRPVRGLTQEDFEVLEGGRRQDIASFEPIVVEPEAASTPADVPLGEGVARALAHDPEKGRCFLVFVDDLHLGPLGVAYVRKALPAFLEREVRDGDWVTVMVPGQGIWWTARTPAEHRLFPRLVAGIHSHSSLRSPGEPTGEPSDYDSMQSSEGLTNAGANDPSGLDKADSGSPPGGPPERAGLLAQMGYLRALRTIDGSLAALDYALESLRGFKGRKSLLLYSEGFVRSPQTRGLTEIIDLARQANVAINWIDPRGLASGLPTADASLDIVNSGDPQLGLITVLPSSAANPLTSLNTNGGGTVYLAEATGGRVSLSNDPTALFHDVLAESSAYYLLGYAPADHRPGERRLEVRVRGEGRRVLARGRYFVRDPGKQRDLATPAQQAVAAIGDEAGVPLGVQTFLFDRASIASKKAIDTELVVQIGPRAPEDKGDLKLLVEARSITGGLPVRLVADLHGRPTEGTITVARSLALAPGAWQVRVVVSDPRRGAVGSVLQTIEVPAASEFRVSTPVLSDHIEDGGLRPQVKLDHRFAGSRPIYWLFEVFGAQREAKGLPRVSATAAILRDDQVRLTLASSPIEPTNEGRVVRLQAAVLAGLEPGDYELEIRVTDEVSGQARAVRESFTIVDSAGG